MQTDQPAGIFGSCAYMGFLAFLAAVVYVYFCYSLMVIAKKTDTEHSWMAWIPLVNVYLMCQIAGKPGWWTFVIVFLIPPIGVPILWVIVWMGIAEARGRPSWWGLLWLIPPPFSLVVPGIIAFTD